MGIRGRIPFLGRIDRYEQATVVGIILVALGSSMSWINVEATAEAAAQLDDIEAGTTVFTGFDVNFGEITFILAIIAAVVLAVVLWRFRGAGRVTGLAVMLIGLTTAAVAVIGIVLAGSVIGGADDLEGVSVGLGLGVVLTILGGIVLLSGGILRLAVGPTTIEEDGSESVEAAASDGHDDEATDRVA